MVWSIIQIFVSINFGNKDAKSQQKGKQNRIYKTEYITSRTESVDVISAGASKGACPIVISVAISLRASFFEETSVLTRLTRVRRSKRAATAKLRRSKRFASALACHSHSSRVFHRQFQLRWTNYVQIRRTTRGQAFTNSGCSTVRNDRHRDVVNVDEADVEEIKITGAVECELCQCSRRFAAGA